MTGRVAYGRPFIFCIQTSCGYVDSFYDNTNVFTVPAGHLFVLGDNRSRVLWRM